MTKKIFYILSVLVTIAAAIYSFQNSKKLQAEIDLFTEEQKTKIGVERFTEKKQGELDDTKTALEKAETDQPESWRPPTI